MEIALGVIVILLIIIAGLLWDTVHALNRLEGVIPAAMKWLDEVERKENIERMEAHHIEERISEQQREEELTKRKETAGCQETTRGGGLRYVLPAEPDYQYSVPLEDSTKAHFVLCNDGFEHTLKEPGFWAYVRTRQPGYWISGWPVPTREDVENACKTLQKMGYLARMSGDQVTELVDSVHDGYPYRVAPNPERPLRSPRSIGYRLGAMVRRIARRS
jgi:hypothetical protein